MQLLSVKAVLTHHLIDELLRRRVIGKITGRDQRIVLRFKEKTAGGGCRDFSRFRFAATGS